MIKKRQKPEMPIPTEEILDSRKKASQAPDSQVRDWRPCKAGSPITERELREKLEEIMKRRESKDH